MLPVRKDMKDIIKDQGLRGIAMKSAPNHRISKHLSLSPGRLPCFLPLTFHHGKVIISTTGITWGYSRSIPGYIRKLNKIKDTHI